MALMEDSPLRMFLNHLRLITRTHKPNFDVDIAKYLGTVESNISTLLRHPDSPFVPSGPNSNDHVHFQNLKHEMLCLMKKLYAQMENDWLHHLFIMKEEFLKEMETFLGEANSDSTNSISLYGPGSSQFRLNQESTQTSNFMSSSSQDVSKLMHPIKMEDMETEGFPNMSLNCLTDTACTQFVHALTYSPTKAYSNQLLSYSTANASTASASTASASNAIDQSFIPGMDTISPTSAPCPEPVTHSTPNATTLTVALNNSTKNATDQNLISESRSITIFSPQIEPRNVSPKKKFGCIYCERSYNHESELKRHMPKHTNEKSFVCRHCGKGFPYQGARDNHQKNCKKITN